MDLCVLKDMNLKWQVDYSCWKKNIKKNKSLRMSIASTCVHKKVLEGGRAGSDERPAELSHWILSELNGGFNGKHILKHYHVLVGGLEYLLFFHSVGNFIIPTDEVSFFRGVGIPPTSVGFCLLQAAWTLHVIFTSMGRVYGRL